ncbi:porin family protein [Aurantibacter aestuarii]|uniref:Outer membrane protein beta-barrel domain-containing protein n=1 Tax=Aurantibacter aestuarii TaxID=1266046 RepID=A0A2T1N9M7_9FLAO|nr:porin family protein [Aurantibacter aestuarii]PSG88574.1 hypothetical protein C7H52_09780 [Aurantibacter aestuarii]
MKKLLLSAAVALMAITANAQDSGMTFGAKAGLNVATIGGDVEDASSRISFHVGGYAEFMVSDKFSVQPELVYSSQGTQEEYKESFESNGVVFDGEYEDKLKLDYINLPVMAKFYVTEGFSLEAGPQVGFLIGANVESEGTESVTFGGSTETESFSEEVDVKDSFKGIDFAVGVGAGYKLDGGLNFAVRYNLGLSNIYEDSGDFKAQNNVFQFSVGYSF